MVLQWVFCLERFLDFFMLIDLVKEIRVFVNIERARI